MELSNIINRIERILDGMNNSDTERFDELFEKYSQSTGTQRAIYGLNLWKEIKSTHYIPENLDSDDDIEFATLLINTTHIIKSPEPLMYAFIVMHHRLIFGDLLEKAFISQLFMKCIIECDTYVAIILRTFIEHTQIDDFYTDVLDDADLDLDENNILDSSLYIDMLIAVLPNIQWLRNRYPESHDDLNDDFVQSLLDVANHRDTRKPALPKLSAVCRFLYEYTMKM